MLEFEPARLSVVAVIPVDEIDKAIDGGYEDALKDAVVARAFMTLQELCEDEGLVFNNADLRMGWEHSHGTPKYVISALFGKEARDSKIPSALDLIDQSWYTLDFQEEVIH